MIGTVLLLGETVTVTGKGAAVIVMLAIALLEESDTEVAVKLTVAGFGILFGPVYVMAAPDADELAEIVPHFAPLQPAPESVQLTPLFCASFCTVAVNVCVPSGKMLVLAGATLTAIAAGADVTVTMAVAERVLSATEVALTVRVDGLGRPCGAI